MYLVELEIKDTTDSNSFNSYLHLFLSIRKDSQTLQASTFEQVHLVWWLEVVLSFQHEIFTMV